MDYALFCAETVTLWETPDLTCRREDQVLTNIADEALYGWPCRVLESRPGWARVRTHYGYTGWVREGLLPQTEPELRAHLGKRRWVVRAANADVLSLPRVQGVRLCSLPRGSLVEILDEPTRCVWVPVRLLDGQSGYIRTEALAPRQFEEASVFEENPVFTAQIEDEPSLRAALTARALEYLGVQYRWGGKSPRGIDCSGLAQMCYMLCGVNIYRDAKIAPGWPIHAIDRARMQPGDLLYFAGHVALYLGGQKYIHSTAHDGSAGLDINSLDPAAPDYRQDLAEGLLAVGSLF